MYNGEQARSQGTVVLAPRCLHDSIATWPGLAVENQLCLILRVSGRTPKTASSSEGARSPPAKAQLTTFPFPDLPSRPKKGSWVEAFSPQGGGGGYRASAANPSLVPQSRNKMPRATYSAWWKTHNQLDCSQMNYIPNAAPSKGLPHFKSGWPPTQSVNVSLT